MSDVQRLLAWFEAGALVRPDPGVPNTVDLSRAIASICGAADIELSAAARGVAGAIGPAEHVIFVMADGLGMNLIERLPAKSFFRAQFAFEMQAVFPSSTAPAVTSLATGAWPSEHAVPGWFTYLPDDDLIAAILPFVERFSKRPLGEFGVTAESAFPVKSWLPRFGNEPLCYMPSHIVGSVYSNYFTGGAPQIPYERLSAAVEAITTRIAGARAPTYTYLYVPFIDTAEHEHGPHARAVSKTLAMVERAIATLAEQVDGHARVVISADHGVAHIPKRDQIEIKDGNALLDLLALPPSSEPRVPLFHAKHGAADAFAAAFRQRFNAWALLSIDEVDELRLLGPEPLTASTRRRMGDFMAISATLDAISYKPDDPMIGYHGGLRPEEMRIPLILS